MPKRRYEVQFTTEDDPHETHTLYFNATSNTDAKNAFYRHMAKKGVARRDIHLQSIYLD